MKQITADLYLIEPELYAERRGAEWFTSNEQSEILSGPFATLAALEAERTGTPLVVESFATPPAVDPGDLMTLRQAAKRLPVSSQALYARRAKGGLPEPRQTVPSLTARSGRVDLYSLADLAPLFEGTHAERTSAGARRGWAKLSPEERAARVRGTNR